MGDARAQKEYQVSHFLACLRVENKERGPALCFEAPERAYTRKTRDRAD